MRSIYDYDRELFSLLLSLHLPSSFHDHGAHPLPPSHIISSLTGTTIMGGHAVLRSANHQGTMLHFRSFCLTSNTTLVVGPLGVDWCAFGYIIRGIFNGY